MPQELVQCLHQRRRPLLRLPQPPAPDDDVDMAGRSTYGSEELLRMIARMAGALRRLCLQPSGALVLAEPSHTLEQFLLWMTAVLHGHDVHVITDDARRLPRHAGILVCPPARKERWQAHAARKELRLATLGGHWEGSFFMLQMVQPASAEDLQPAAEAGRTWLRGEAFSLEELLQRADALAAECRLQEACALLVSLPVLQAPSMLAAALAALRHADAPLHWLAPAQREEGLRNLPPLPQGSLVLADGPFIERLAGIKGLPQGMRHVALTPE